MSHRSTIAIIGAGGYVGARFMHVLRARPELHGVAIVRSVKSLARLSDAPVEARVVNTADPEALAKAVAGCDTVINSISGDVSRILPETQLVYEAAVAAGCQTLIHLSSAVVFGRVKSAKIHDDSPPEARNWMLYARGKANSELYLRDKLKTAHLRIVVLRPGLIWGPGSHWVLMAAEQLARGPVCLSNEGTGIANLIYVDNLIRMILAVHGKPSGMAGFYNVADPGTTSWLDYYRGIARRTGYSANRIRTSLDSRLSLSTKLAIEWCLQRQAFYRSAKWLLPRLGTGTKSALKAVLNGEPLPPGFSNGSSSTRPSREQWSLQNTLFRLPTEKFMRDYGPLELLPFGDALAASAAWLEYAGYGAVRDEESGPNAPRLTTNGKNSNHWLRCSV